MIELNVGENETVRINWGEGIQRCSFIAEPHSTRTLVEERDKLRASIKGLQEERDAARANVADANYKIQCANERVQTQIKETERLRGLLVRAQEVTVEAGTRIYMLDAKTSGDISELKEMLKNAKPGPITFVKNEPKWQPIETAPKNGSIIMLYRKNSDHNWIDTAHGLARWMDNKGWILDCEMEYQDPSHWMPLPESPR